MGTGHKIFAKEIERICFCFDALLLLVQGLSAISCWHISNQSRLGAWRESLNVYFINLQCPGYTTAAGVTYL